MCSIILTESVVGGLKLTSSHNNSSGHDREDASNLLALSGVSINNVPTGAIRAETANNQGGNRQIVSSVSRANNFDFHQGQIGQSLAPFTNGPGVPHYHFSTSTNQRHVETPAAFNADPNTWALEIVTPQNPQNPSGRLFHERRVEDGTKTENVVSTLRDLHFKVRVVDGDKKVVTNLPFFLKASLVYENDLIPVEERNPNEPLLHGAPGVLTENGIAHFKLRVNVCSSHHDKQRFRFLIQTTEHLSVFPRDMQVISEGIKVITKLNRDTERDFGNFHQGQMGFHQGPIGTKGQACAPRYYTLDKQQPGGLLIETPVFNQGPITLGLEIYSRGGASGTLFHKQDPLDDAEEGTISNFQCVLSDFFGQQSLRKK